MASGLPTTGFPQVQLLDAVLGNRAGSTAQASVAHLAAQIGQLIGVTGGAGSAYPALASYAHATDDPDTVTLSGGYTVLADGMEVAFVATETNTGGDVTINLDGLGALPAWTASGVGPLPAGYLRPGLVTRIRYYASAGGWTVNRDQEDGEDASGASFTRWETGLQICHISRATLDASMTWNFPAAFIAPPQVNVTVQSEQAYFATVYGLTETSVTIYKHNGLGAVAEDQFVVCATAIGRWY